MAGIEHVTLRLRPLKTAMNKRSIEMGTITILLPGFLYDLRIEFIFSLNGFFGYFANANFVEYKKLLMHYCNIQIYIFLNILSLTPF